MKTIELQIDDQPFEQVQRLAEARQYSLQALIIEIIEQLAKISPKANPLLGMFAQEPELLDQVLEAAMRSRETVPLRQTNG